MVDGRRSAFLLGGGFNLEDEGLGELEVWLLKRECLQLASNSPAAVELALVVTSRVRVGVLENIGGLHGYALGVEEVTLRG